RRQAHRRAARPAPARPPRPPAVRAASAEPAGAAGRGRGPRSGGRLGLVLALVTAVASGTPARSQTPGLEKIEHIVVIYAENRSFDPLYGLFPGANGLAGATAEQKTQLDRDGRPLPRLPPVWKPGGKEPDPRFPRDLPNGPFRLDVPPIGLPLSTQI